MLHGEVPPGESTLRGFDEPVRLYEVRWREEGWWSRRCGRRGPATGAR